MRRALDSQAEVAFIGAENGRRLGSSLWRLERFANRESLPFHQGITSKTETVLAIRVPEETIWAWGRKGTASQLLHGFEDCENA
ncbi:hypothetical protein NEUTE2DRAFT_143446 [Neurospora tetrasperma FGSC 2509]|nr:hypothetical protein NEUTE2DRAFT_143446 [Neurospora tetrasperma FGSC 2509]